MSRNIASEGTLMRMMQRSEGNAREFMAEALELAHKAGTLGETPVGAVIVKNGKIIGKGYNRVESENDPTAHAEIVAIRQATKAIGDWRLLDSTIYVTLEPCIMCTSALILARIKRVVYGARDNRWGAVGSLFDFSHDPRLNHEIEVISGFMAAETADLLRKFFQNLR